MGQQRHYQQQPHPLLFYNNMAQEQVLSETAFILNTAASDEGILALRTTNYAYNVVDPRASMFCDLFKTQFKEQEILTDKIGRHIRGLGYKVPNLSEKLRFTRLDVPKEGEWPDCNTMVTNLLNNHETIIQSLCKDRERVKDLGVKAVEDLILEVERCHMQWAWQLRTHIQTQTGGTGGKAQH